MNTATPIPPKDRYGYCEACSLGSHMYRFQRKPMYIYDGHRLCDACCREAQVTST